MIFTITDVGLLAASNAQTGGPRINITQFKVGAGVAYPTATSQTDLKGALLYTGSPSTYSVINANTVEYTLILNDSIGNFNFGEIGLYLENGTLFAISALDKLQEKTVSSGSDAGNVISIEARLMLTQVAAVIEFPIYTVVNARFLEVGSLDLLKPPFLSDSNAYLAMSGDDILNSIPSFRAGDYRWTFPSYSRLGTYQVTRNGVGYTTATVVFQGGSPSTTATASAVIGPNGDVASITLTNPGAGYQATPYLSITGDGNGASAYCNISSGVSSVVLTNGGSNYTATPAVVISGGGGTGATATAVRTAGVITAINITNPGKGYLSTPAVSFVGGGGTGALASAVISGVVSAISAGVNSPLSLVYVPDGSVTNLVAGRYVLAFTSGPLAGYVRHITASAYNQLSWATAFGSSPLLGNTFDLYASNSYFIGQVMTQTKSNTAHNPAQVLSESDIALSGTPIIDGYQTKVNDRVLVTGQTNQIQNGLFVVTATGAWTRGTDATTSNVMPCGSIFPIQFGTKWASSMWTLMSTSVVPDSSPLVFGLVNQSWIKKTASSIALSINLAMS